MRENKVEHWNPKSQTKVKEARKYRASDRERVEREESLFAK